MLKIKIKSFLFLKQTQINVWLYSVHLCIIQAQLPKPFYTVHFSHVKIVKTITNGSTVRRKTAVLAANWSRVIKMMTLSLIYGDGYWQTRCFVSLLFGTSVGLYQRVIGIIECWSKAAYVDVRQKNLDWACVLWTAIVSETVSAKEVVPATGHQDSMVV